MKGDLEGFCPMIMGGLMDTFLQNPLQFAVGGAFAHTALWEMSTPARTATMSANRVTL